MKTIELSYDNRSNIRKLIYTYFASDYCTKDPEEYRIISGIYCKVSEPSISSNLTLTTICFETIEIETLNLIADKIRHITPAFIIETIKNL
ncbi:MAG: hypothetical protein PHE56_08890 [Bacteroidales bacterium]|jgi:hypothetical protein|nr:hypothetical protein [Bacteroidales bacterium]